MGAWFDFECEACGYKAHVCGGSDSGEIANVTTIECVQCKRLQDALTATWETGKTVEHLLRCRRAKSHAVRKWVKGDPCPKCGGTMRQGEMFTIWD